jgi:hypothetical protein
MKTVSMLLALAFAPCGVTAASVTDDAKVATAVAETKEKAVATQTAAVADAEVEEKVVATQTTAVAEMKENAVATQTAAVTDAVPEAIKNVAKKYQFFSCQLNACDQWQCEDWCRCFDVLPFLASLADSGGLDNICPSDGGVCDCPDDDSITIEDPPTNADLIIPGFDTHEMEEVPEKLHLEGWWDPLPDIRIIWPRIICGDWYPTKEELVELSTRLNQFSETMAQLKSKEITIQMGNLEETTTIAENTTVENFQNVLNAVLKQGEGNTNLNMKMTEFKTMAPPMILDLAHTMCKSKAAST